MLYSVIKAKKKYYSQTLLEEYKYEPYLMISKKVCLMNYIMILMIIKLSWHNPMMEKIMMNPISDLLNAKKCFRNNKSLIVYVNYALLGFYFY